MYPWCCYLVKRFKLIAESISVIMLIGVAIVAGYVVYRQFIQQTRIQQTGLRELEEQAWRRIGEKVSFVDGYILLINLTHKKILIVLYNYGDYDITIREVRVYGVFLNGSIVLEVFKLNYKIPQGELGNIVLYIVKPEVGFPPGALVKAILITESRKMIEINLRVVRGG